MGHGFPREAKIIYKTIVFEPLLSLCQDQISTSVFSFGIDARFLGAHSTTLFGLHSLSLYGKELLGTGQACCPGLQDSDFVINLPTLLCAAFDLERTTLNRIGRQLDQKSPKFFVLEGSQKRPQEWSSFCKWG